MIYLGLSYIFSAILFFIFPKKNIPLYNVAAILILIISSMGLKNHASDYESYKSLILNDPQNPLIEPLARFLIITSNELNSVDFFYFIIFFIFYFFIYLSIRQLKINSSLVFFVFLTFPNLFIRSIDVVRQFAAGAILIYGLIIYFNNKNKTNVINILILIIIASLFHASVIAIIPIIIISNILTNKKLLRIIINPVFFIFTNIILYLLSEILINILLNIFSDDFKYSNYLTDLKNENGKGIYFSFFAIINLIIFFIRKNIDYNNNLLCFLLSYNVIGLFIYTISMQYGEHLSRFYIYICISLPFLISSAYFSINNHFFSRLYLFSIFLSGTIFYLSLIYLLDKRSPLSFV